MLNRGTQNIATVVIRLRVDAGDSEPHEIEGFDWSAVLRGDLYGIAYDGVERIAYKEEAQLKDVDVALDEVTYLDLGGEVHNPADEDGDMPLSLANQFDGEGDSDPFTGSDAIHIESEDVTLIQLKFPSS